MILCMAIVPLLVVGSVVGYYYYSLSAPISNILGQQVKRLPGDEDPNISRGTGGSILTGGRINILLLGSDTDEKFTNADGSHTYLAQTDIVVSVDPATKDVTMFSIPRDFWVNVPGFGMHKLDEAYALGGVALSRLTIYQDFGISINYYAWVGLDGFVKVIDTVGGIDIDIIHPITDDQYPDDVNNHTQDIYGYKRLYLAPGPQHLGGIEALEYVRSRHADLVGDFGRSARQQQVLKQLKNKLNNPGIVEKFQELANDLSGYVKTDMQLTDVFSLLRYARTIDTSKINQVTLGPPYSSDGFANGKSVVIPHCDLIVPVIEKVFGSTATARCNITDPNAPPPTPTPTTTPAPMPTVAPTATPTSSVIPAAGALIQTSGDSELQTAGQMINVSALSLNGGTSNEDLLGIHSLLDLEFLAVFESPDALQV
jgi:LCP family protein required for cell wall assembly